MQGFAEEYRRDTLLQLLLPADYDYSQQDANDEW
jgi:hypothetical protein